LVEHFRELKVCTTEMDSLQGEYYQQVLVRRQRYFELTRQIVTRHYDPAPSRRPESENRERVVEPSGKL